MSIRFGFACDVCEKALGPTHITNMPTNGRVDVPMFYNDGFRVQLTEPSGKRPEGCKVEWHLCSEECFATWATEQAQARRKS